MTDILGGKIGYVFSDPALLETALTHSSTQNDKNNNERLEFLGDRVLGLAVADLLFTAYPQEPEGSLAKRHTGLVQQEALVNAAQAIGLAEHLKLSAGEMKSGGQKKEKILADGMEALIGAIYLDGGLEAAEGFIAKFWGGMLQGQALPPEDAKSLLQEWAQGRGLPLPEYKLLGKSGTDHAPSFEIEVSVEGIGKTSATAASKRSAEKEAAAKMLEKIGVKL
jgi:ribonuclease-3